MLEFLRPAAGKGRAIAQAEMRTIVEDRDVRFAEQARDRAERAAETAVEKHGVFAPEILREFALQFAMQIGHAGEHGRAAGAESVGREGVVCRGDDLGMIGQAEVIVGAKVDHRLRLPAVGDGGASFGGGAHFGLVKFHRPRSGLHPAGETGGRLERVAPFAGEEIAQTQISGIVIHKKTAPNDCGHGGDSWKATIRFSD